ncbi:MAG: SH3 domain-containing protein [Verrucomicrobia bacterium]|nr:SH3 domain-containing protein [Verrucomicrobiota bacterium]
MSKFYQTLCVSLSAFSMTALCADEPASPQIQEMPDAIAELTAPALPSLAAIEPEPVIVQEPVIAQAAPAPVAKPVIKAPEVPFSPFTGKVKGRKVRMRLQPDLDSRIIKELNKNDFLSVIGDKGEFWAVEPPAGIKAFVFRSFILDNVVEGNRVNVRLEPNLDAPIIGHLNAGDKVDGVISAINNKWLEIAPPSEARFYVAKEFVEFAGGPEVKQQMDKRRLAAEQLLDATSLLSSSELRKPFEEVDFDRINKGYNIVISDYTDFPEYVEQAKESLSSFQEAYLQKRISHLESQPKAEVASSKNDFSSDAAALESLYKVSDKMKSWDPVEHALFSSWTKLGENQTLEQYYEEQKLAAVTLTGIVEPYNSPVKSKPGDFIIKDKDLPVAYVYSTVVNLQSLSGKQVKLIASPRPNNNFAFPAYFVLAVE